MNLRTLAGAAAIAVLATTPAQADHKTKVNVRVEGKNTTLFEGNVNTTVHQVTGDSTGPHKCDGTNAGASSTPGPTLTGAFDDAMTRAGIDWDGSWNSSFEDFLIQKVGPDAQTATKFWGTVLNWEDTQAGGCQIQVERGDKVLVAFDSFGKPKLRLTGLKRVEVGDLIRLKVLDGVTGDPIRNAKVGGTKTSSEGRAFIRATDDGKFTFKASKKDTIRSNRFTVRVVED